METSKIYLDYASTTPCDKDVVAEMVPYFGEQFGNPNSIHDYGQIALEALTNSRIQIKNLINSEFDEIVFTSGSTESNNIAIIRSMQYLKTTNKNRFITLKTEHKSVLDCADYLNRFGFETTLLDVKNDGTLEFSYLEENLNEQTGLVSICFVNNETGVAQDIKKISKICCDKNILLHIDATQAFGKIPIDVKDLDIDFLSASGHKIYGPKGIGVLFGKKQSQKFIRVPRANPEVEFGIRSGTIPVPLCVGLGKAAEIAQNEMSSNINKIKALKKQLIEGIFSQLDEVYINGSSENNYPGIINISFRGCEGEALMMEANRIAVSSGSACTSNKLSVSHVLAAMGIPSDIAQSSLRITIGKYTESLDIDIAIEDLVAATNKLRLMSPIWDMIKSGIDIEKVFQRRSS
ncbi:MAG: cysteine desulfurase [Holosporales bacterium]|jgi:cysteine desulfurase|nr:cysteine desulfurase [Holosporales bacterium]